MKEGLFANKKGASHVEFIISIILFIGIVGTAIYFLNPVKSTGTAGASSAFIYGAIVGLTSTTIQSYSVTIDGQAATTAGITKIGVLLDNPQAGGIRVEDSSGQQIGYGLGNIACFNLANAKYDGLDKYFAVVEVNHEFLGTDSCGDSNAGSSGIYQISSTSKRDVISVADFKKKIISEYDTSAGYARLKNDLGASGNDFSVSLDLGNNNLIAPSTARKAPTNLESVTTSRRVEVLDESGSTAFGELTLNVW